MSYTEVELIMLASVAVSVVLTLGFFFMWLLSVKFQARCDCALYYGLFLALANVPRLLLDVYDISTQHEVELFVLDVVGFALLFFGAQAWSREKAPTWLYAIFVPAVIASMLHHALEVRAFAAAYALLTALLLVLTLYYIQRRSPNWMVAIVAISFMAWTALNLAFPHTGNPVGHAFGMVTKVLVFGTVMAAYYERQHRELFEAAKIRELAIEAITGGPEFTEIVHDIGPAAGLRGHQETGGADGGTGERSETCGGFIRQNIELVPGFERGNC